MPAIAMVAIITAIAGIVGTGLGGVVGAILGKDSTKVVSLLLSFAGGIMLAVVAFDLMPVAINPTDTDEVGWYWVILFVLIGYGLVQLLNYFIDKHSSKEVEHSAKEEHPHAHDDLDELIHADHLVHHKGDNKQLFWAGLIMAIVIALHNVPEGMVIGASYAIEPDVLLGGSGLIMAVVIGLHNIPEGMAVSVPLIAGGTKRWKAVLITASSGVPTVIGALIGFGVGALSPLALSICLSLASGAMLYVVFGELLPESILMWKSKLPAFFLLLGVLVGFVLVLI
ncbi:MAG: ZIP family metal transporter [Bacilli bacterium]|nr:ZIP family metal transporter [Bacilli bacterium]